MTTGKLARLASGYGLLEGARWYPEHGLVFSDMTAGGVYRLPGGTGEAQVLVPYRKAIGGLVAHADGGLVVSGRNVSVKRGDATMVLLAFRRMAYGRLNWLTCAGTRSTWTTPPCTSVESNTALRPRIP